MPRDQVLSSETSAPPEKSKYQEDISGYQKTTRPQIVVTANGLKIESNLNPNALEFYPTWILPKLDRGEGNVNLVTKETFSTETLQEIKRSCHYDIIQEIVNKNDSLVEIIEMPEKELQMVANVVVEEIIERKFSEKSFEKSLNDEEEMEKCKNPNKIMESIKYEMITKCEEPINCKVKKEDSNSNGENSEKSNEVLVKCREEESKRKKIQIEANIDPQVLFFGPATLKYTESSIELKQNMTDIEILTKTESVEEVKEGEKRHDGQYSGNTIIENTVVGDHTEAYLAVQINNDGESQMKKNPKRLDDVAPTSTTKIEQTIPRSVENKLKYNNTSRIAVSGTLKVLSRTTTGNMKSTETVKKLLSPTSTTKETKILLSASTARSCLTTSRKLQNTLEAKQNETCKNVTQTTNLSKMSTNTKKTSLQSKSSSIASNSFIKKDILAKSKTKDSISLRSTCSTDKSSLSNKSSSLSSTVKVFDKPISKSSLRPIEKAGLKRTAYLTRSPGGTVSSNLRKTETQKRQNLFPDSDAIKMTDILFK